MQAKEAIRALATVCRETTQASDERQLVEALCSGLHALGAVCLSLGVLHGDRFSTLNRGFGQDLITEYAELPASSALPGPDAARSQQDLYLTDAASTINRYPAAEEILAHSHHQSVACLPLCYPGGSYGYLAVHYTSRLHFTRTDKAMLEIMATAATGALARLTSCPRSLGDSELGPQLPTYAGCLESLSPREAQVLTSIMAGLSNAEIAEREHLSINSIKSYIRGAYRKIGVETRTEAVLWGAHHGLVREVRRGPPVRSDLNVRMADQVRSSRSAAGASSGYSPPPAESP